VIANFIEVFEVEGKDYHSHLDFVKQFSDCFQYFFFGRAVSIEDKGMRFVYDEFIFKLAVATRAAYCAVIAEME
jgi:hypothetical protein